MTVYMWLVTVIVFFIVLHKVEFFLIINKACSSMVAEVVNFTEGYWKHYKPFFSAGCVCF